MVKLKSEVKEKYLLENNIRAEQVHDLLIFLRSFTNNSKDVRRWGDLTTIIRDTPIFAYDLPVLVDKYPVSFITENTVFFNADILKYKRNTEKSQIIVANAIMDLVEQSSNIKLNKEAYIEKYITSEFDTSLLDKNSFLGVKNLNKIAKKEEISHDLLKLLSDDNTKLKTLLDNGNLFMKEKVNSAKINKVNALENMQNMRSDIKSNDSNKLKNK